MAKKKIYAVRKGHKTGLFNTWAECQKATAGYSGAERGVYRAVYLVSRLLSGCRSGAGDARCRLYGRTDRYGDPGVGGQRAGPAEILSGSQQGT